MFRKTLTILSLVGVSLAAIFGCFSIVVLVRYDLVEIALLVVLAGVAVTLLLAMTAGVLTLVEGLVMFAILLLLTVILLDTHRKSDLAWCAWFVIGLGVTILNAVLASPMVLRRKREKLGLCVACGYDLRGLEERCPECGTTF